MLARWSGGAGRKWDRRGRRAYAARNHTHAHISDRQRGARVARVAKRIWLRCESTAAFSLGRCLSPAVWAHRRMRCGERRYIREIVRCDLQAKDGLKLVHRRPRVWLRRSGPILDLVHDRRRCALVSVVVPFDQDRSESRRNRARARPAPARVGREWTGGVGAFLLEGVDSLGAADEEADDVSVQSVALDDRASCGGRLWAHLIWPHSFRPRSSSWMSRSDTLPSSLPSAPYAPPSLNPISP